MSSAGCNGAPICTVMGILVRPKLCRPSLVRRPGSWRTPSWSFRFLIISRVVSVTDVLLDPAQLVRVGTARHLGEPGAGRRARSRHRGDGGADIGPDPGLGSRATTGKMVSSPRRPLIGTCSGRPQT